jgi:lipoprotein-anchoring transpeptidase ErfK/SrfK
MVTTMRTISSLQTLRRPQWWLAVLSVSLLLFLSACGGLTAKGQAAQQEKAKLDAMLRQATDLGVPDSYLVSIRQQEQKVGSQATQPGLFGDSTPDGTYQKIITSYQALEAQVASVSAQAAQDTRMQAHQDIQTLDQLLQTRQNEGYLEVPAFQARLTKLEQDFDAAQTPAYFQSISASAKEQTLALQLMKSADQDLQSLQDTIKRMQDAGLDTTLAQQEYDKDLDVFRTAAAAQTFKQLRATIAAQVDQLAADQVAAIPAVGAAMIDHLQQLVTQAQQYGEDVTQYQQQVQQDQADLRNANNISMYLELSTRIRGQISTVQVVVARGKARYDLQQLQTLIGKTDINNDYEYQDANDAYADQQQNLQNASTLDDYQSIDSQVNILTTNLNALLTNLSDSTSHEVPHATDLQLMKAYGITSGKVAVVSLTEQTLRLYQDGQFVRFVYIVTGQRDAQTPPGLWHIFYKGTNLTFKSPEPPGSPLYYPPTPINYGMEYHSGGFFFHDATWRSYFGPGANLPHDDQTSGQYSNNGSHGCINMTLANAAYLYDWFEVGTPAIVY